MSEEKPKIALWGDFPDDRDAVTKADLHREFGRLPRMDLRPRCTDPDCDQDQLVGPHAHLDDCPGHAALESADNPEGYCK